MNVPLPPTSPPAPGRALFEGAPERLRAMLAAVDEAVVIGTDANGDIDFVSPAAEQLLGRASADLLGQPVVSLFRDRELGRRRWQLGVEEGLEALVTQARAGVVEAHDWTWPRADGTHRTISLSVSAARDDHDVVTGFALVGRDVTEVRHLEAALASQGEVQGLLVAHLPSMVVGLVDSDLRWVRIAGSWLAGNNLESETFIGHQIGERLQIPEAPKLREFVADAFDGSRRGEFATRRGEWFEIDALPVKGPENEPMVLLFCREITARKESERDSAEMVTAFTATEEGFRTAFDDAPMGVALTTTRGSDARFLRVNRAFADLVGREGTDLRDTLVAALVHPEDQAGRHAVGDPDTSTNSLRYVHSSGRAIWVEVNSSVVRDSEGAPRYVINHVEDITARRQSERALFDAVEQQRAASEQLREIDRVRVDTMSTISHELRTPLTSVEGYLELLAEGAGGELSFEQQRMLGVVRRNAGRLGRLVNDLLELSRLESMGSGEPTDQADVDLNALASAAIESIRPMVLRRRQEISLNLAPGEHVVVGVAEQLDRVLMNLLANATKYTPDGGRIAVRVDRSGDQIVIHVEDSGIGIPEEEQRRLFDRFFRSTTATQKGIEGTGLGLAIAHSIVERHQGKIEVVSAPGSGSWFTVTLPSARESSRLARAHAGMPAEWR